MFISTILSSKIVLHCVSLLSSTTTSEGMDQLKLPDMYTCHLIKLYYRLYRNKRPTYFENVIPEYGESQHDLRYNNIHLPAIRCQYENINSKYQMHYRLRELANSSRPPFYPIVHIDGDTFSGESRGGPAPPPLEMLKV